MTETQALPEGFEDLQPFVAKWALKGQKARYSQMLAVDMAELRALYDAVLPRVEAIVAHLDRFPLDEYPPAEQALFDLAATFAETAHPVDFKWKAPQFDDIFPFERVRLSSASEKW